MTPVCVGRGLTAAEEKPTAAWSTGSILLHCGPHYKHFPIVTWSALFSPVISLWFSCFLWRASHFLFSRRTVVRVTSCLAHTHQPLPFNDATNAYIAPSFLRIPWGTACPLLPTHAGARHSEARRRVCSPSHCDRTAWGMDGPCRRGPCHRGTAEKRPLGSIGSASVSIALSSLDNEADPVT